jgi:putative ABC transport system ATP-binding protein
MSVLTAQNLKKYYGKEPNIVRALDGVDIEVNAGEFVAVVGTSGSGKSTLLHMLGGLDAPTEGTVVVNGYQLGGMSDERLAVFRRRSVGFVFQNYNLVPILSVYENIVLPVELDGGTVDKVFVDEILDMLGIADKRNSMPNQLSGGQQQRVAIARALAAKPSIILADEPTGNLDSKTSQDVLDILKTTSSRYNQTMIIITHNEHIAQLAGRIIHIEDGKIV